MTFVLKGRTVVTNAKTEFKNGACQSIKAGKDIRVEGVELADRTIQAATVTRQ